MHGEQVAVVDVLGRAAQDLEREVRVNLTRRRGVRSRRVDVSLRVAWR